jgi:hypothetical protein
MSIDKLSAGSSYDYLTRQVAALDSTEKGNTGLAAYYADRGEAPGVWIGSGIAGIDGLTAGDPVTAEQMRAHVRLRPAPAGGAENPAARRPELTESNYQALTRLGGPFKIFDGDVSPFQREVAKRIAGINEMACLPTGRPASVDPHW